MFAGQQQPDMRVFHFRHRARMARVSGAYRPPGEMTMRIIIRVGVAAMATAVTLTAQAADRRMPVYKAPPQAAVFNWTGCYMWAGRSVINGGT